MSRREASSGHFYGGLKYQIFMFAILKCNMLCIMNGWYSHHRKPRFDLTLIPTVVCSLDISQDQLIHEKQEDYRNRKTQS